MQFTSVLCALYAQSIQSLTASLQKKDQQKKDKQRPPVQVTTATFTPSDISRARPPVAGTKPSSSPPGDDRELSPPIFDVPEEELQWREPTTARPPVEVAPEPVLHSQPPSQAPSQPDPGSQPQEQNVPPPVPPHRGGREREREEKREREVAMREKALAEERVREPVGLVLRRQAPKAPRAGGIGGGGGKVTEPVPLRKKVNNDRPAGVEEGQVVGMPAGYRKLHPPPSHPAPAPPSQDPASDLADQETALRGLPPSSESLIPWCAHC